MAYSNYLLNLLTQHFFTSVSPLPSPAAPPYGTGTYLGLVSSYYGMYDYATEISGNGYVRQQLYLLYDETYFLLRQSANVTFPVATGTGWGYVVGLAIYNTIGGTSHIFTLPWWQTSNYPGPPVAGYTVSAGHRPYFLAANTDIKLSIHGLEPASPTIVTNGGISTTYAGVIAKWIVNLAPVPYARTYNVALGRNLQVDEHGRFAGVWSECSGTGYQRMPISNTDWYGTTGVFNNGEIVFPTALSTWGTISHVVLYPSDAPAVPAFWAHLATPYPYITAGQTFLIGPQRLGFSFYGDNIVGG
jgi:hypothetical protein